MYHNNTKNSNYSRIAFVIGPKEKTHCFVKSRFSFSVLLFFPLRILKLASNLLLPSQPQRQNRPAVLVIDLWCLEDVSWAHLPWTLINHSTLALLFCVCHWDFPLRSQLQKRVGTRAFPPPHSAPYSQGEECVQEPVAVAENIPASTAIGQ